MMKPVLRFPLIQHHQMRRKNVHSHSCFASQTLFNMANNIKTGSKLTLCAKVDIVEFLTKGNRQVVARKHFDVHRAMICKIWKNKDAIMKQFLENKNYDIKCRKSPYDRLEEPLLQWFRMRRLENVPISGACAIH